MTPDAAGLERSWRPGRPVDVPHTFGMVPRGRGDPSYLRTSAGTHWRASRTPEGPGTVHIRGRAGAGEVELTAWGPGAAWLLATVPDWLGAADGSYDAFTPTERVLRDVHRRLPWMRVPRTGLVLESLIPTIIEQKVTGGESRRSFAVLSRAYGEPAPGPAPEGLRLPPSADAWRHIPSWEWHRAGVGPQRAQTCIRAARMADRLETAVEQGPQAVYDAMTQIPGVGPWTCAEVGQRALGDPDAVSVGDAHVPRLITWALTGRVSDTDEDMQAALEPYRGHRFRVQRLLELSGIRAPRFGPRYSPLDFRSR